MVKQHEHSKLGNVFFKLPSLQKPLVVGFCAVMSLAAAMDSFAAPKQAEYLDRGVVEFRIQGTYSGAVETPAVTGPICN